MDDDPTPTEPELSLSMKILVLSPRQAWPADTGAKLREAHMVNGLGGWAEVEGQWFQAEGDKATGRMAGEAFPRPQRYTTGKILGSLLSGEALSIANYRDENFASALVKRLKQQRYDLIWMEALHMAAYLPELEQWGKGTRRIWNWHNIESELMRRYAERAPTVAHRWYAQETARRLERLESQILKSEDGHVVCSGREEVLLRAIAPKARLAVMPNGVDCAAFPPRKGDPGRDVLFVGSLDYGPNLEGLRFFVEQVWKSRPLPWPGARLRIVGSKPTAEVKGWGAVEGVEVLGRVDRVEPYYEQARLAIVPIFSGGGTRLKVLEAFAAGAPVLSTRLGVEGITANPGEHYVAAETAEQWREALEGWNDERGTQMAEKARHMVEAAYDWKRINADLRVWLEGAG